MADEKPRPDLDYSRPARARNAKAAFVLGVLSIPFMALVFAGAILALIALVLGVGALLEIRRNPVLEGKSEALAGIVFAGIALLLGGWCATGFAGLA
jgi:hypothetical protein